MSVTQVTTDDATDFNIYHLIGYIKNFIEIRMMTDVMTGEIFVVDLKNIRFAHLTKLTPIHIKKVFMAAEVRIV